MMLSRASRLPKLTSTIASVRSVVPFQRRDQVAFFATQEGTENKPIETKLEAVEAKNNLREVSPNRMQIKHLAQDLLDGSLNLLPEYQRGYVWTAPKASRLIVTALCGRIIPAITLHEKKPNFFDTVDGKQRLSTLLAFFLAGKNPGRYKELTNLGKLPKGVETLRGLDEDYHDLNGLTFEQLPHARREQFSSFNLHVIKIPHGADPNDVFSVYEDINSGGEDLSKQQLRKASFWGDYIKMLLDLAANNTDFQRIRKPKDFEKGEYKTDPKEYDCELILRAMAWEESKMKEVVRPMKKFLNQELTKINSFKGKQREDALAKKRETFEDVMRIASNIFAENAFREWGEEDGTWDWKSNLSRPLWDVMYVVLADLLVEYPKPEMYTKCKKQLQDAIKHLFQRQQLDLSGTSSNAKLLERKRIINGALHPVLKKYNPPRGPRNFPDDRSLKKQLYDKQRGLCGICGQTLDENRMNDGDYAHVDHKVPYSTGGSSTIDNASLAHKECNQTKGANHSS